MSEAPAGQIGIVIAAYNAADTLMATLDSLFAQTDTNWRAVVVDDGSLDATLDIARTYEQRCTQISVITQPNQGTATARNNAIARLDTEFFAYLDADDQLKPGYIASQRAFAKAHPGHAIYAVRLEEVRSQPGRSIFPAFDVPTPFDFESMLGHRIVSLNGAWIRRTLVNEVGGFALQHSEDWDLLLRLLKTGATGIANPIKLYCYNIHDNGRLSDNHLAALQGNVTTYMHLLNDPTLNLRQRRLLAHRLMRTARRYDRIVARQIREAGGKNECLDYIIENMSPEEYRQRQAKMREASRAKSTLPTHARVYNRVKRIIKKLGGK